MLNHRFLLILLHIWISIVLFWVTRQISYEELPECCPTEADLYSNLMLFMLPNLKKILSITHLIQSIYHLVKMAMPEAPIYAKLDYYADLFCPVMFLTYLLINCCWFVWSASKLWLQFYFSLHLPKWPKKLEVCWLFSYCLTAQTQARQL